MRGDDSDSVLAQPALATQCKPASQKLLRHAAAVCSMAVACGCRWLLEGNLLLWGAGLALHIHHGQVHPCVWKPPCPSARRWALGACKGDRASGVAAGRPTPLTRGRCATHLAPLDAPLCVLMSAVQWIGRSSRRPLHTKA